MLSRKVSKVQKNSKMDTRAAYAEERKSERENILDEIWGGRRSVWSVVDRSDAALTRALYRRLLASEPYGELAVELLTAQKASERAKKYGRSARGMYRSRAYDRKGDALMFLTVILEHFDFEWGFGDDATNVNAPHVLYIDLPTGQVSWHCDFRGEKDYPGEWDGSRKSQERILEFVDNVVIRGLSAEEIATARKRELAKQAAEEAARKERIAAERARLKEVRRQIKPIAAMLVAEGFSPHVRFARNVNASDYLKLHGINCPIEILIDEAMKLTSATEHGPQYTGLRLDRSTGKGYGGHLLHQML